ncbi:unnamed protein product [Symbiodinium sp. KB8]|nr:unnamed protein product [Symbiodinium sp. KB8]
MDESQVELQWPTAYVATAFTLEVLLTAWLLYQVCTRQMPMGAIRRRIVSYAIRLARSLVPFSRESKSRSAIHKEVRALRFYLSRKIVAINLILVLVMVLLVQMRVVFQLPATIQGAFCWTLVGTLAWMTMSLVVPQTTKHDLWYVIYSCILLLYLLPMNSSTRSTTRVAPLLFTLFRLPAILTVDRIYLVFFSNLPFLAVISWRAAVEDFDVSYGGRTAAVGMECLHIAVLVALAVALQDYLAGRVELEMESCNTATQLTAASSLLQLTCDAVVELDGNLRLTKHSKELAAMLLRDTSASLEGVRLIDLVAGSDTAAALSKLTNFRSRSCSSVISGASEGMGAHAFHTRLVDSYATKLQTEILQVMYTKRDGSTCHLVGLRDFTDTKPYTGVTSQTTGFDSEALDALADSISFAPQASDASQVPVQHGRGTLFLEIDVDGLQITAASSSLVDLVGAPTSQVFPAAQTIQLLERIHSDGRMRLERGERPPAKVFSYDEMPAQLRPTSAESIWGTMQVLQAPCTSFFLRSPKKVPFLRSRTKPTALLHRTLQQTLIYRTTQIGLFPR